MGVVVLLLAGLAFFGGARAGVRYFLLALGLTGHRESDAERAGCTGWDGLGVGVVPAVSSLGSASLLLRAPDNPICPGSRAVEAARPFRLLPD